MATQDYTKTLVQLVSGSYIPITTGTYYLRAYPFTSNTYTGTHIGSGTWKWSNIQDNDYQIWDGSSQVTSYGTIYIGDKTPNLESLNVDGDSEIGGTLTLQGDSLDDSLVVYGQTNFHSSVNHNGSSVAHISNCQVATISENNSGAGITFSHAPKFAGTISGSSALTNLAFTDAKYYPISGTSAVQVYTPTNFRGVTAFGGTTPPVCGTAPTNFTHLSNKGYVDSEISTRISAFTTGSFQESPNCVRLIPNGTIEPNKVYTQWNTALNWGSGSATSTNIKTILLCGNGTSNSVIDLQSTTGSKFVIDYVNIKSVGVVTVGFDGNLPSGSFGTNQLSKIIIDGVSFYGDDSDLGNTGEIQNVIFRNTKFYIKTSIVLAFTGCEFQNCYFDSYSNNQYRFINCKGLIHSEKPVTVTGTNKINVDYNKAFDIGGLKINSNAGSTPGNSDITVTKGHGDTGSGIVLSSPQAWMQIVSGSNTYSVPMYLN